MKFEKPLRSGFFFVDIDVAYHPSVIVYIVLLFLLSGLVLFWPDIGNGS